MKYICCYSGGHSSSLVAVEAVRRYGKENVVLLNHDISSNVEHEDIKRFKQEVADYLGVPITYANADDFETRDPITVSLELGGFKFNNTPALCTYYLKTKPFADWLGKNYPVKKEHTREDITVLYGFDKEETTRINRRVGVMNGMGYKTDYPLAFWDRTIYEIEEIGVNKPITYERFKHANCIGCLKAGRQHWFLVYCLRPDIFQRAKEAEEEIGFSIIKHVYMEELEVKFKEMVDKGITPTEHMQHQTFWASVRKELQEDEEVPCECFEGQVTLFE